MFKWNKWDLDELIKDEISSHYKEAIKLQPEDSDYWHQYGWFLREIHEWELALKQYMKSVEIKPDIDSFAGIAVCYIEIDDLESANEFYLRALEVAEDDKNLALYSTQYGIFLTTFFDDPDIETASKYFEKAIELDKENYYHYSEYADMIRDYANDPEKATRYYLKALELKPYDGVTNVSYGYLLYLMERYEEANDYIMLGAKYGCGAWAQFCHGLLNKQLGNDEIAQDSMMKAIEFVELPPEKRPWRMYEIMQKNDKNNAEYIQQFVTLLSNKFQ